MGNPYGNPYAGQPHRFYCQKCRCSKGFRDANGIPVRGTRWRTTGRVHKRHPHGANRHHWGDHSFQYECLDCGHVGFSGHPDVASRHAKEHGIAVPK